MENNEQSPIDNAINEMVNIILKEQIIKGISDECLKMDTYVSPSSTSENPILKLNVVFEYSVNEIRQMAQARLMNEFKYVFK